MQPPNNDAALQNDLHDGTIQPCSGRSKLDLMDIRRKLRLAISSQIAMLEQVEEALNLPPDKRYQR